MKFRQVTILFLICCWLAGCNIYNFDGQKYTTLKPLPVPEIAESVMADLRPPDTLMTDTVHRPVYVQTEKHFYYLDDPEIDTSEQIVYAFEILRSEAPEPSEDALIIKISERNFKSPGFVDLKMVDSIYYRGGIIQKSAIKNHLPVSHR